MMAPPAQVPRVFLLPQNDTTTTLTIITLPHPRTSAPTRFLLDESTGLHEITKIVPPASAPRSWLLAPATTTDKDTDSANDPRLSTGHTLQDPSLYLTTPYDPLFLILPALLPPVQTPTQALYRPLDDLLDALAGAHWDAALRSPRLRAQVKARVKAISDPAPGADAFRPSMRRALEALADKCDRMADGGLPPSMEAAAVARVLSRGVGVVEGVERLEVADGKAREGEGGEEGIRRLLRVKTAAAFLAGTYLLAQHAEALEAHLAGRYEFAVLDRHLAAMRKERSDAAVLRAADFAIGGGGGGGGGGGEGAKKRRKGGEAEEAEGKKKVLASRAVRDLGKANTKGMAKMTSFFKKKET